MVKEEKGKMRRDFERKKRTTLFQILGDKTMFPLTMDLLAFMR